MEQNPTETSTKVSSKEYRRQEGTDIAEEGIEAEDKASRKASKKAIKSETAKEEDEGNGHDDDNGGERKRGSKERKKSKQEVLTIVRSCVFFVCTWCGYLIVSAYAGYAYCVYHRTKRCVGV